MKTVIERFRGRDGLSEQDRRWTAKVTDVRNWFVFAASERWREDDAEYEHYSDSGGKSGGQKEKLAYTILAASLAYQFGLEWAAVRSRSFRFVVIDEAFGRGSDESTQYGLELFSKLNLQLLIVTPLQKIPRHRAVRGRRRVRPQRERAGFLEAAQSLTIREYRGREGAGETRGMNLAADRMPRTARPAGAILGARFDHTDRWALRESGKGADRPNRGRTRTGNRTRHGNGSLRTCRRWNETWPGR